MKKDYNEALKGAMTNSLHSYLGKVAKYIPELENVNPELTGVGLQTLDGKYLESTTEKDIQFTLQSVSKVILLIGLLEDLGPEEVFKWVGAEASGRGFSSVARLDQFGPYPSNPFLNAGAIALCDKIPGQGAYKRSWINSWTKKLNLGEELQIDEKVLESEILTGNRNRSLAHLLKSNDVIVGDVEDVLMAYFNLCSIKANLKSVAAWGALLAGLGKTQSGERVFSANTAKIVTSLMAICGLYNQSGSHLMKTGIPAKSGVSGLILGTISGVGGISVYSPRVSSKGTSVRGELILSELSRNLDFHFAHREA